MCDTGLMITANILELWPGPWPAGLTMLGLGAGFAIALLIAREKLKVEVDPRMAEVYQVLPNLNCGGCGFAGCIKYAEALLERSELVGRCAPGGPQVAEKIAQILNLQVSNFDAPKRPVVRCRAHTADKTFYARYEGIRSCTAANALSNAQACKFGCLGFGDCEEACKFDALHIVDDLAVIDYEKCTGCGACSKVCPRNLIQMTPFHQDTMMTVACNSIENGRTTRSMCKVGCIGCGLCAKQSDIFIVKDNLARLDYEKYEVSKQTEYESAMNKCPTKVIICVGKADPP